MATGDLQTLSDLGISLQKDGTLKLDSTKLNKAIEADFSAVTDMVAAVGNGFKTGLNSLIDSTGSVTSASESANRMVKELQNARQPCRIVWTRLKSATSSNSLRWTP
jgi:flagellar hook-associated protein 2